MLQVVNRADAECQASAERSPSPQTPHPRATDARSRGIKFPISEQVHQRLADVKAPITVAIMGCVVNGPGEADGADVAICAGKDKAILYRKGEKIRTVPADEIADAVVAEVRKLADEHGEE